MVDIGENTGLYLYSAILQANMALLALLGVFIIFRLERIDDFLQRIDDRIIEFIGTFFADRHARVPIELRAQLDDIGKLRDGLTTNFPPNLTSRMLD
jgi:hypothetical protein